MEQTVSILRSVGNSDWATITFVAAMILVASSRAVFETRFADFINLAASDKYIKVYRDSSHLRSSFTIAMFIVQLIAVSFFIHLALASFVYGIKTDWIRFVRIFTLLSVFVLSKFLLEMIIGTVFRIEEFVEQFNLAKVSYRTYIGLFLLPVDLILYYNYSISKTLLFAIIATLLLTNLLTYVVSLKNYQNLLMSKLFYFILYLCALEIAPYYFLYYSFTKN